jgi:D-arabinose 1-dehydrogenase-like Zn-dependent alcohol dehydrogenase
LNRLLVTPHNLVFNHVKMVGILVVRNKRLRAMFDFAAKHNVRAKKNTYSFEGLNDLVEDHHRWAVGKLAVDMKNGHAET